MMTFRPQIQLWSALNYNILNTIYPVIQTVDFSTISYNFRFIFIFQKLQFLPLHFFIFNFLNRAKI